MHQNYFVINKLASFLNKKVTGFSLKDCYSNTSEDLQLIFADEQNNEFYLQVKNINSQILFALPVNAPSKGRLFNPHFKEAFGLKVESIHAVRYDRVIYINFEGGSRLMFTLFGRFSNITLFNNQESPVEQYNKKLTSASLIQDKDASAGLYNAEFCVNEESFSKHYPFIHSQAITYLKTKGFFEEGTQKEVLFDELIKKLNAPGKFYVSVKKEKVSLSLFKQDSESKVFDNIDDSLNFFTSFYARNFAFSHNYRQVISALSSEIKRKKHFVAITKQSLETLINAKPFEHIANILMANLHAIKSGDESAKLFDFYENKNIIIKLDKNTTPQKLAEKYYRKSRNLHIEIDFLKSKIKSASDSLIILEQQFDEASNAETLLDLKPFNKLRSGAGEEKELPYKVMTIGDYHVLIGKHAKSNDLILREQSHKNDIWLHAKDVAGSHVLIKNVSGKPVPQSILEKAAAVAAWHSKSRKQSVVPVICTERKYVRKIKGAAPGAVVVDKEKVLLVKPLE